MSLWAASGFWLPYAASKEDMRRHAADFERTRIAPGADPRAEWDSDDEADTTADRVAADDPEHFESGLRERPRVSWRHAVSWRDRVPIYQRLSWRYVPVDVCRWRDPDHRAALTERARAYATDRVTYARPTKSTPVP